jgi:hypothetical protein
MKSSLMIARLRRYKIQKLIMSGLFFSLILNFSAWALAMEPWNNAAILTAEVQNRLLPFTSDGCSRFPDGFLYKVDKIQWQHCCVRHDIAYWQGGTADQRLKADQALNLCVASTEAPIIGEAMYLGVRVGGYNRFPFTWRWGYGWAGERGYLPLNPSERAQVAVELKKIPKDLSQIPVVSFPSVGKRNTITGDYCMDQAIVRIEQQLGRSFEISKVEHSEAETSSGILKNLNVGVAGCEESFQFNFLLLRANACLTSVNEGLARMRIRLLSNNVKSVRCQD